MSADPWLPPTPAPSPAQSRRRGVRWWLLAVGALIVLAAVGVYVINGLRVPKAAQPSTISALPEATLLPPGASVLSRAAAKPAGIPFTVSYGSVTTIAGVNLSKADVFAFYRHQLTERGWHGPDSSEYASTDEWAKAHYRFQLEFLGRLGDPTYPGEANYTTTFRAAISYDPTA